MLLRRRLANGGAERVTFKCPDCGAEISKPLHWYKSNSHYECQGCRAIVLLDDDLLTPIGFAGIKRSQRYVNLILPSSISMFMLMRSGLGFEHMAQLARNALGLD